MNYTTDTLVDPLPAAAAAENSPVDESLERYHVHAWGDGYFSINASGNATVRPFRSASCEIDIHEVVAEIKRRGISSPVLIRFQDVLRGRVVQLNEAFGNAVAEMGYQNRYTGVYPIKVNQLHEVVEEIIDAGTPFGMGLECGSKTELVAALPHLTNDETLLICNGYKDQQMIELILSGQRLGKNIIPVVEKFDEFLSIMRRAKKRKLKPKFGVRVRLSTSGSGRWAESGGDRSKFGISIPELLRLIEQLHTEGLTDAFRLLHFHLGSQISNIQTLKRAVKEISQVYTQLHRRGIPVEILDVGGGLGVNYEGSYQDASDGINYTLQEYANAIVQTVKEVCDNDGASHPTLVSESGRAITAHHSVLIVETLAAYRKEQIAADFEPADTDHSVVHELHTTLSWVRTSNLRAHELLEAYHDASGKRQEADTLFSFGYLSIEQKAMAEQLYWSICNHINAWVAASDAEWLPSELDALNQQLVDQYLCDFSVFQSVLDHWAIGQRFPIMPIHRHREEPTQRGVLVDLTCDSDGKISRYVSANDDKRYLDLHMVNEGEPYYLGFFMMGAYQDIMGDTHNLFGRVSEVHVYADEEEEDGYYIEKVIPGTSIQEMLAQVQYFPNDLQRRMQQLIRTKTEEGLIRPRQGVELLNHYNAIFGENTYYLPDYTQNQE